MLTLWGLYRIGRRIPGFPAWIELPEYINCPLCTDTFPVISNYDPLNCVPHMRIWSFKRARYSFRNFVLKRKHVAPSLEYFPALPSALFIHWKYTIVWNHSHVISGWGYGLGLWGRSRGHVTTYFSFIKRNVFWGSWPPFLCEHVWAIQQNTKLEFR